MTNAVSIAQSGSNNVTMRNRLINGGMVIDQRNSGASVNLSSSTVFLVDRWAARLGTSTGSTGIRSTTAPAGFINSTLLTIGTGASPSAGTGTNYYNQIIEGFNCADLGWGTANAQPVTLSFWVRSSLTGSFGVCVANNDINPSYPTSYTINAANTWEYKTITVPGPTSGTFATDNTGSLRIIFDWGNGSDYKGTANTWANADYRGGATGTTNICATSGATWYITGVQLEEGTAASPFENRLYGTELALCQRYCYVSIGANSLVAGAAQASDNVYMKYVLPVPMRATPSISFTASVGQPFTISDQYVADFGASSPSVTQAPTNGEISNRVRINGFTGLTTGRWYGGSPNLTGSMTYSAEL